MLWVSYGKFTNEGIKGLIDKPQNRAEAVSKLMEPHGGKLISYYFLLNGDIDFIIITETPDEKISELPMIINSMLVRGSDSIESMTTVPIVSAEDAVPYMQKAQKMASAMTYQAPRK